MPYNLLQVNETYQKMKIIEGQKDQFATLIVVIL